jgi:hypothetical protein
MLLATTRNKPDNEANTGLLITDCRLLAIDHFRLFQNPGDPALTEFPLAHPALLANHGLPGNPFRTGQSVGKDYIFSEMILKE